MMTWDELNSKLEKIGDEKRKLLIQEFGSMQNLAFGILESLLFDCTKYSSICLSFGDREAGYRMADAQILSQKLSEVKKEFERMFNA